MKKNKFLIALALVNLTANGQSFVLFPSPSVSDTLMANHYSALEIRMLNVTTHNIHIQYQKLSTTFLAGWSMTFDDYQTHWLYSIPGRVMDVVTPGHFGYLGMDLNPHLVVGTGEIKYRVWDIANPSIGDTLTFTFVVTPDTTPPISVDPKLFPLDIKVFPNPAIGQFFLQAENGKLPTGEIQLFSMDGETALRKEVEAGNYFEIPVHGLCAGIYSLRFTSAQGSFFSRLMIE